MNNKSLEFSETDKNKIDSLIFNLEDFCELFLNFEPFDYQKEFLNNFSKRIAFRSGRQVGKSSLTGIKALYRALIMSNEVILILSRSQRQSSLLFNKIREMINSHPILQGRVVRQTFTMLYFKNGSQIYSLPAGYTGETVRGFSPTLIIIDEAAFVPDSVFVALEPSLSATDGDLWMLSTPFGKRGRFYDAFMTGNWTTFHVKSEQNPLITKEFLESQKSRMTELDFLQEYMGEFVDEADTYFTKELVLSCVDDIGDDKPNPNKIYFLGVDCARFGNDETVYTIGETEVGSKELKIINILATSKKPVTDIIGRVMEWHKTYKFRAVYMDATGLGGGAVDVLKQNRIPLQNMEGEFDGVTFTLKNKQEMYKNLKLMMEQKRIKYPKIDKLIMQLADMQYEYTHSGGLKLHHPDNGHDDFPDSLALACCGIRPYKPPLMFTNLSWK